MKRVILFIGVMITLSSCELYVVEPRIDYRNRVVGSYDVDEYSRTFNDHTRYDISISKSGYSNGSIRIHNFYGIGVSVLADLSYDRITIPVQYIDGYEVEGVGTVYDGYIRFSYSVRDTYYGTRTDFCESEAYLVF